MKEIEIDVPYRPIGRPQCESYYGGEDGYHVCLRQKLNIQSRELPFCKVPVFEEGERFSISDITLAGVYNISTQADPEDESKFPCRPLLAGSEAFSPHPNCFNDDLVPKRLAIYFPFVLNKEQDRIKRKWFFTNLGHTVSHLEFPYEDLDKIYSLSGKGKNPKFNQKVRDSKVYRNTDPISIEDIEVGWSEDHLFFGGSGSIARGELVKREDVWRIRHYDKFRSGSTIFSCYKPKSEELELKHITTEELGLLDQIVGDLVKRYNGFEDIRAK